MKVRCFCPKHGELGFKDIMVRDNLPVCMKCRGVLEFVDMELAR